MTFNQLHYIIEISKIGSISKAAKLLLQSPANLSNTIRALEKELGLTLFIRTRDGLRLTDEGELFIVQAQIVLNGYNEMMRLSAAKKTERFAVGSMQTSFCTNAFARFSSRYQSRDNIRMSMQNCDIESAAHKLQTGRFDLAVTLVPPSNKSYAYEFFSQRKIKMDILGFLPMNIYMRKGHPLLKDYKPGKDFDFRLLNQYPYVDYVQDESRGRNLRNMILPEIYNVFPDELSNTIWVDELFQKDMVVCGTDAYAIGLARPASHQNPDVVNIPLPECLSEMSLCTSMLHPENRLIPEFRELLMDEFLKSPEFIPVSGSAGVL